MRTLSKNIKKWLRIFITLDIFYEEIRSFLGILLNCTSLFYVKSFCCWCPIISPIYSAMYVSNVWMRHCVISQNGKFYYYGIGNTKVDVYNVCIIYAFSKINIWKITEKLFNSTKLKMNQPEMWFKSQGASWVRVCTIHNVQGIPT